MENYNKQHLIENANDFDKEYIKQNQVTWNKTSSAYTFIHQYNQNKLFFKLVYLFDNKIENHQLIYDQKEHPLYPLPDDNVQPQFDNSGNAYFHADAATNVAKVGFIRGVILYTLPPTPLKKPEEIRCRVSLSPYLQTGIPNSCQKNTKNFLFFTPFPFILKSFLNPSSKHKEFSYFFEDYSKKYDQEDKIMVYYITKTKIPQDYKFCMTCPHLPTEKENCVKTLHYFEDLPVDIQYALKQHFINQNKINNNNKKYNPPFSHSYNSRKKTFPYCSTYSINNLLTNEADLLKRLEIFATKKKYYQDLNTIEQILKNIINNNSLSYYPQDIKKYILTVIDQINARNALIESIEKNDITTFSNLIQKYPTALNRHSVALQGGTPLHLIINKNYNEFLIIALKNKAKLDALDEYDRSPLFYAIFNHNLEIAQILVDHNASTDLQDYTDNTILHYALLNESNNFDEQKKLIKFCSLHSQAINQQNNFGNTPVHLALLTQKNIDLISYVFTIDHINPTLTNKRKETVQTILEKNYEKKEQEFIQKIINDQLQAKCDCSSHKKFLTLEK